MTEPIVRQEFASDLIVSPIPDPNVGAPQLNSSSSPSSQFNTEAWQRPNELLYKLGALRIDW
jgi:hypothetical protein